MRLRAGVILTFVTLVQCKKSGEDIADALYRHPKECKDPNDGGIWAPLAPGHSCGPPGHDCNYPEQWCSARSSSRSVPQFNCVKLPDECKRVLAKDDAKATEPPKTVTAKAASGSKSNRSHATQKGTTTTTEATIPEATSTAASSEEERTTTAEESTEATTTEEIETTTAAEESSEEIETTVRTRRPRPFKANPDEEIPRVDPERVEAEAAAAAVAPPAPEKPAQDCKDRHPLCCFWAANFQGLISECDRNALWMKTTCQKSCGTCGCTTANFQTCRTKLNVEGCPYLQNQLVQVPVASRGGGVFSFPTAGGSPLAVPIGGGFGAPPFIRAAQVAVPLGNINGAVVPPQFGPSRIAVPVVAGR